MRGSGAIVATALLISACSGVPTKAVRAWAKPNFKQFVSLVEDKYQAEDTRLNAYASLASLICDADTADRARDNSLACKCQNATTDEQLKAACTEFVQQYR